MCLIQPPFQWISRALFFGVNRPGPGDDHSRPSSAEAKNLWCYEPFSFVYLHGLSKGAFYCRCTWLRSTGICGFSSGKCGTVLYQVLRLLVDYFIGHLTKYLKIIIIIIIYLSWSWATCWPVPVSRIHKSLQRPTMIPSTRCGVVFFTLGNLFRGILFTCWIQLLLYSNNLSKISVTFNSFAICAFVLQSVQVYP